MSPKRDFFNCSEGDQELVHFKEWLPNAESGLTTGPLILYQRNQDLSFYKWFADEEFLRREYSELGKSIKQIARDLNCSASTISKYLLEVGIEPRAERLPRQRRGQIPFGMRMQKGLLVPHLGEQAVIEKLRQMRTKGKSYGDLVDWVNTSGIRSKNGGRWDRPTVYKILKRNEENSMGA